ncbi:MAG: hypothetical protein KGO05_10635, partial [Chloroflexota bacterium]|nr:hypothetical protein [Chloroflexota bacterium]
PLPSSAARLPQPAAPRRRFRGRWIGPLAAALLLIALGGAFFARGRLAPTPTATPIAQNPGPGYLQIAPREMELNCPIDIAWSPDAKRIALLGYAAGCPDGPDSLSNPGTAGAPGLLLVYNAKTGALESRATLDDLATGGGLTYDTKTAYLAWQTVLWSPDGATLALPFFAQRGTLAPQSPFTAVHGIDEKFRPRPTVAGVLLLDAASLKRDKLVTAPYTILSVANAGVEWNLITGKIIHPALTLPPALGYHWGAGGALLVDAPLGAGQAPTRPPLTPVGDPVTDSAFTIWQPGQVALRAAQVNGLPSGPAAALYFTQFAAWSPDGAYLLTPAWYGGRVALLQGPQPDATQLAATGYASAPLLPARDAALAALYTAPQLFDAIAWRPDGKALAVWDGGVSVTGALPQLPIYDATTGRKLVSLPVPPAASSALDIGLNTNGDILRWSPDGKRLALLSGELSSLVIWSVK